MSDEMKKDSTCYLERSAVRQVLLESADEDLHITEGLLMEIDALPIFSREDDEITKLRSALQKCVDLADRFHFIHERGDGGSSALAATPAIADARKALRSSKS